MQDNAADRGITIEMEREVLRLCEVSAEAWTAATLLRTSKDLANCLWASERLACARRALLQTKINRC